MIIKRATHSDIPAIRYLLMTNGAKMVLEDYHINKRDIALQARDKDTGALVGFLWIGLMAKNQLGYLDKFVVDKAYSGKGIGNMLAKAALEECLKQKVRQVFGIIKQDEYHDKSCVNALKMAMGSDAKPYTYVMTDIDHCVKELGHLGV